MCASISPESLQESRLDEEEEEEDSIPFIARWAGEGC